MSYDSQSKLMYDGEFSNRCISCATEQSETYINDQRLNFVAVAKAVLKGNGDINLAFIRLNSSAPGMADKADNGDGTVDSTKITDGDILSATQANWQVVAALYFNEDGTPIGG